MKYDALANGADVVPISSTFGISEGMGVVSTRTCWLNLDKRAVSCNCALCKPEVALKDEDSEKKKKKKKGAITRAWA